MSPKESKESAKLIWSLYDRGTKREKQALLELIFAAIEAAVGK